MVLVRQTIKGLLTYLLTYLLNFSIVAQSFEQITGSVYQIWLHLTEFTHCA